MNYGRLILKDFWVVVNFYRMYILLSLALSIYDGGFICIIAILFARYDLFAMFLKFTFLYFVVQADEAEVARQRKLDDAKNSMKIISPSESSDESDDEESLNVNLYVSIMSS
jgi:hypothetical protein